MAFDERKSLAARIDSMLRTAINEREGLSTRWATNEAYYRNQPPGLPSKAFPDAEQYHVPLTQPKIDALTASVCGTITGADPYVIAKTHGQKQDRMEPLENDIHYLLEAARFDLQLRRAAVVSGCCGVSIMRVMFETYVQGFGASHHEHAMTLDEVENPLADAMGKIRYAGLAVDVIHPNDFAIFPSSCTLIQSAKALGHRFYRRVQEVMEFQAAGRYYDDVDVKGGDSPDEHQSGRDTAYAKSHTAHSEEDIDQLVELWSLLVRLDLNEDGVEETYEITYALSDQEILDIRPYLLSRPWYFDFRYHVEYGGFWPAGSVAQNLQGLQAVYNELHNLLIDGSYISAFPPIFYDGSPLVANQAERYAPGDMIQTEGGMTPYSPTARFNGQYILPAIQQIERIADQTVRISQNGGGTQMRSGITATEVAQIAAAQQAGINEYVANMGLSVVQVAQFSAELYRMNFLVIKSLHLDALMLEDPPPATVRYELNGKSALNTAAVQITNAQMLMQFAQDVETGLDKYELAKALVDASQLRNGEKIQHPKEEVLALMAQMQQQAQMMDEQAMLSQAMGGAA